MPEPRPDPPERGPDPTTPAGATRSEGESGPETLKRPSLSMSSGESEIFRALESELPRPETLARALISEPVHGPVRVIFLDLDGTLTDGVIGYVGRTDFRNYWIRDGIALQWAQGLNVLPVVISGRASSESVVARMEDLGLEYYGGIADKVKVAGEVLKRVGAEWPQCVMVGDDLPDVALMKRVGWPIAVANAQPEVKLIAKTVLGTHGGHGAVREMVEMVLRHNGTWEQVLRRYEAL